MGAGDFHIGKLYRLARPDPISQSAIREGHGYLWLGERAAMPDTTVGANFKSLATGTVIYFHYDEMEQEG
jgi:hypothetical protein